MKREILFRGKRVDNGKWEYGSFTHVHDENGNPSIIPTGTNILVAVLLSSVGQAVGVRANKNKMVYDGDIIMLPKKEFPCLVEWHNEGHCFRLIRYADKNIWKSGYVQLAYNIGYTYNGEKCEVIGNVFDNPELLQIEAYSGAR